MATPVPAALEATSEALAARLAQLSGLPGVTRLHVDFADGVFVSGKTVDVGGLPPLPRHLHLEAHLMVERPEGFEPYAAAGFRTLVIHAESFPSGEQLRAALESAAAAGLEPALCLNLSTPIAVAAPLWGLVRHVQLMAIVPGAQGNAFHPGVLPRIRELRAAMPHGIIEVDGGVNLANCEDLAAAGADLLVAGSVLTRTGDALAAWDELKQKLNFR